MATDSFITKIDDHLSKITCDELLLNKSGNRIPNSIALLGQTEGHPLTVGLINWRLSG